jgi:hypothetical protein
LFVASGASLLALRHGDIAFILGHLFRRRVNQSWRVDQSAGGNQADWTIGRIDRWPSGRPVSISSANQPNYYFNNKTILSSLISPPVSSSN